MEISKEIMMKLQNGSDIRGIAVTGDKGQPITLTGEAVNRIAQAFVGWLGEKIGKQPAEIKIAVGHDSRITARALTEQCMSGIGAAGAMPYHCGLASTPSMFMSTHYPQTQFDGAIMVTASHLPYFHNGMKFFHREGGLEKGDITLLLEKALELKAQEQMVEPCSVDLISLYASSLCGMIREGVGAKESKDALAGLHVVVDAGNGAGGFFVEKVLKPLGADTTGSQYLEPDGMFPNHVPNPENKEAMAAVQKATVANGADLGIIFDTDVDRMSAVLPDGAPVNRDAIIAMMAAIIAQDYPGATVVTDSVTSHRLTAFLEGSLGMRHHRFKRGYKNVINEAIRLNEEGILAPLAIETSGHGALKENYFLDDGAYMAVKLLIAAAKAKREKRSLSTLIQAMPPLCEDREYRLPLTGDNFKELGGEVLSAFQKRAKDAGYFVEPNSHEGVRLSFSGEEAQGWMLLRLSLHDPLMPLNMEGVHPGDCDKLVSIAKELLSGFEGLDLKVLK